MSSPPLRAAAVSLLLLVLASVSPAAAGPRVEGLRVERSADGWLVSFDVDGAFTERALERLAAGLPLVFRHSVELQSKRAIPIWFPRVVAQASVVNRVEYDSLTRRYELTRRVNGHRRGGAAEAASETSAESTESLDRVREFMGRVRDLPLLASPGLARAHPLRLRVESSVGRRYTLLFIPTAVRATAVVPVDP